LFAESTGVPESLLRVSIVHGRISYRQCMGPSRLQKNTANRLAVAHARLASAANTAVKAMVLLGR
jgi:hypothetical protein